MIISDLHYLESVDTKVVGGSGKHYSLKDYLDYLEKYFTDFTDYLQTYKDKDSKVYKVYTKGNFLKGKGKGVEVKTHSFASPGDSYSHYSVTWM